MKHSEENEKAIKQELKNTKLAEATVKAEQVRAAA